MERSGITRAEVRQAIEALRAHGREPTLRNVRLQIGRGSYGTLLRHLDELLPNRRRRRRAKPPQQWVRRQCDAAFRSLWASAYRRAARELATQRAGTDAAVERALKSQAISRAAVERIHEQVQSLWRRLWRLEAQLSEALRARRTPANDDEADEPKAAGRHARRSSGPVMWPRPRPASRRRRDARRSDATAMEPTVSSAATPGIAAEVSD